MHIPERLIDVAKSHLGKGYAENKKTDAAKF